MISKIKKLGLVGLIGAFIGVPAFALEDGNYNCVVTSMTYNNLTKKLPKKDWQKLSFTKKDQKITDTGGEVFTYLITSKNIDIYKNKNFLIAVPGDDVGTELFNLNFEDKDDVIYHGTCLKIKN